MKTELPDAPRLVVELVRGDILEDNRWDAGYYDHSFRENERKQRESARNVARRSSRRGTAKKSNPHDLQGP